MSVNILGFVLQSFWFKTAGFILTLFSPAQRVQAGSLWKHRAEKLLCYSSQPTPAFRAIVPCHRSVPFPAPAALGEARLGQDRGWLWREGYLSCVPLLPAGWGAKSSSSLWRHSGIYLQRPRVRERGGNEDFGPNRGCTGRTASRSGELGVLRGALPAPLN